MFFIRSQSKLTNTIHLTLKMTSAQIVETSVTNNSSFQNYTHLDDHTIRTRYIFLLMLESSGAIELPKCSTIHVSIGERENGTKWLFSSTIHVAIGRSSLGLCVLRASADE